MQRVFFDWSQPLLPAVATHLLESSGGADLQDVVCVTPGRRAGRLLLAQLASRCEADGVALVPPRTITPGVLAETLVEDATAVATREESVLAWLDALRSAGPLALAALVPRPPGDDDLPGWHDLARRLHHLHEELAGAGVAFADVPTRAQGVELFGEETRWEVLARLETDQRERLAALGLADRHAARRAAMDAGRLRRPDRLVLIGVTELNESQRAVVHAVDDRTLACVHAPPVLADRFDADGCVRPEAWADVPCSLRDDQIVVAGAPADQAESVVAAIASLGDAYAIDEVTIGLGAADLAGPVERAAGLAGVRLHPAEGVEVRHTAPFRLLDIVAAWLDEARFAALATLARHPDVERWLDRRDWPRADGEATATADSAADGETAGAPATPRSARPADRLSVFDDYFNEHLPARVVRPLSGTSWRRGVVNRVRRRLDTLLRPLRGRPRPLGEWGERILDVLTAVYEVPPDADADADAGAAAAGTMAAALAIRDALARLASAATSLQPEADAATALRVLLTEVGGERIPPETRADQIEQLGWLELPLDPAPVLVLAGVNDGHVPSTVPDDPFLPDTLRRTLGLVHNATLLARDAYRMETLVHGHERLVVVAGRTNRLGDPLAPSRLLLRCDDETLVRRVARLCDDRADAVGTPPVAGPRPGAVSRFRVPPLPEDLPPPTSLSVTDFRRYLDCGYRFALERLARLEARTDDATELDPLRFGTLAHAVLEQFGADEAVRDAGDPEVIAAYLRDALRDRVDTWFGRAALPAVELQAARLEQRLRAFAFVQARERLKGWRIRHVERAYRGEVTLDVPGQDPMPLRAKIDRIDRNEATGVWRIIDYKTGDAAKSPTRQHNGKDRISADASLEWHDLQLPLYRHLARSVVEGEPELAYIVLPKKASDVDLKPATWTPAQIEDALDAARRIVRDIRAGVFDLNLDFGWPSDVFARLCQVGVFAGVETEAAS